MSNLLPVRVSNCYYELWFIFFFLQFFFSNFTVEIWLRAFIWKAYEFMLLWPDQPVQPKYNLWFNEILSVNLCCLFFINGWNSFDFLSMAVLWILIEHIALWVPVHFLVSSHFNIDTMAKLSAPRIFISGNQSRALFICAFCSNDEKHQMRQRDNSEPYAHSGRQRAQNYFNIAMRWSTSVHISLQRLQIHCQMRNYV